MLVSESCVVRVNGTGDQRMLEGILLVATIPIAMMRHSATSGLWSTCTCNTAVPNQWTCVGIAYNNLTPWEHAQPRTERCIQGVRDRNFHQTICFVSRHHGSDSFIPSLAPTGRVPNINMRTLLKTGTTYWKTICLQHPLNAIGWCIWCMLMYPQQDITLPSSPQWGVSKVQEAARRCHGGQQW